MPKSGSYNFERDLKNLERKVRNKLIKDAQKKALKPLAQQIRQDSPVDSGELKSSIKVKVGNRKKNYIVTVVNISTPDLNPHAARVELGTKETPAEPFIRPDVKRMRSSIVESMIENIENAIKKL